jgi:hypothetical protein
VHPVGVQVTAETYRLVSGQGIGRTDAHRLTDGRVFRRSLADWQGADLMLQLAPAEYKCERCGMTIRADEPIPCWHRDCPEPTAN